MKFRDSDRDSYTLGSCAGCILDTAFKYLKLGLSQNPHTLSDSEIHGIKALLAELTEQFCGESSPNEIAQTMFRRAAELAQIPDPWREIRHQSNLIALNLIKEVRDQVLAINDPQQRLFNAIIWAVAGNVLDYGTSGHQVTMNSTALQQIYFQVKQEGFQINHFGRLWVDLQKYHECLYICDNAGEIAFDRIVLEILKDLGISITAVVKGGPISNDAIFEDAVTVGLTDICLVITTGSPDLGFFPPNNSPEFLTRLKNASVVIAKGQANWEAIYAYQDQLPKTILFYSIAQLKCDVHANLFGFPKGSNILYYVDPNDFREKNRRDL
jgi:uncharacterized protein with ATP-grasp and redox domains